MRLSILVSLAAFSATATAAPSPITATARHLPVQPSRIRFGAPRGGSVASLDLVVRNRPGHVHVTMTLALATRARAIQDVALPIDLSHDITVTNLALDTAEGRAWAYSATAIEARQTYERTVQWMKDPALVEWTATTAATDRIALHVYPVTRDAPGRVILELALPYGTPLVIDPGALGAVRALVTVAGAPQQRTLVRPTVISLTEAPEDPTSSDREPEPLDRTTSLIALPGRDRHEEPRLDFQRALPSMHAHVQTLPSSKALHDPRVFAIRWGRHEEQHVLGRLDTYVTHEVPPAFTEPSTPRRPDLLPALEGLVSDAAPLAPAPRS